MVGGVAVMIDVLRASSTITTALSNGATCVRPYADVDACRHFAESNACLTGGERGGLPLPGFNFGNSPSAYARSVVEGREVCFTTTNGTQALTRMEQADEILIGCFMNRAAVVARLAEESRAIHLVCAGTDGAITAEDTIFAGAVAFDLAGSAASHQPIGTQMAVALYEHAVDQPGGVADVVRGGTGGQNLQRLGLETDIEEVLRESCHGFVPKLIDDRIVS